MILKKVSEWPAEIIMVFEFRLLFKKLTKKRSDIFRHKEKSTRFNCFEYIAEALKCTEIKRTLGDDVSTKQMNYFGNCCFSLLLCYRYAHKVTYSLLQSKQSQQYLKRLSLAPYLTANWNFDFIHFVYRRRSSEQFSQMIDDELRADNNHSSILR